MKDYIDVQNLLGEGIIFCQNLQKLVWVDILQKKSYEYCPLTEKLDIFNHDFQASFAAEYQDSYILVSSIGIFKKDKKTENFLLIQEFNISRNLRTNDGRIDQKGELWFSTMDQKNNIAGEIFKLSNFPEPVFKKILIPNSICFCKNTLRGYFSDSATKKLYSFSLEDMSKELFYTFEFGEPDGAIVDLESNIHLAMWGAGEIAVLSRKGKKIDSIKTPFKHPTCIATFELNEAKYIAVTSALVEDDGGDVWITKTSYNF
ncbi:MAG: hypothetical protein CBC72_001825 [Gammaproteobacteria bacterium TMED112]|nr:MAG: hypothetical protein CBC72_001825 [Gammaproteobacteria bacterium TMED112]|tara:strand:+ start:7899 stop:8678 length:780 start_codon:yes stop_codon:yes gene_type:complete